MPTVTKRPERLRRAMELVKDGKVRRLGASQFKVGQYDVDLAGSPVCYCADMEHRNIEYCKHAIAGMLDRADPRLVKTIADWLDATK